MSRMGEGFFDELIATNGIDDEEDKIFSIELQSQRRGGELSKSVEVYFYYPGGETEPRIVGLVREE